MKIEINVIDWNVNHYHPNCTILPKIFKSCSQSCTLNFVTKDLNDEICILGKTLDTVSQVEYHSQVKIEASNKFRFMELELLVGLVFIVCLFLACLLYVITPKKRRMKLQQ